MKQKPRPATPGLNPFEIKCIIENKFDLSLKIRIQKYDKMIHPELEVFSLVEI